MATNPPSTDIVPVPQLSAKLEQPNTLAPRNVTEAFDFAQMILVSGMAPKAYAEGPPEKLVVAMQYGMEVGLQPMQALRSVAVINGMPSLWGDAALALVQGSGKLEYIVEQDFNTIRTAGMATCIVKRRGQPEVIRTFSMQDAKEAGILGNAVWKTYPSRMMQMRARAFALRDVFPDVMSGLSIGEESQDYPIIDAQPSSQPQQQRATVTSQQANPAPQQAQAASAAEPAKEDPKEDPDGPIGVDKAREFYKTYQGTGYTVEESKAYLLKTFGTNDSRQIPKSRYEEAMRWARNEPEENLDAEPAED